MFGYDGPWVEAGQQVAHGMAMSAPQGDDGAVYEVAQQQGLLGGERREMDLGMGRPWRLQARRWDLDLVFIVSSRGGGFGAQGRSEGLQVEFVVELGQLAFGGDGEQFVAQVHQDAVVAGGVFGQRWP